MNIFTLLSNVNSNVFYIISCHTLKTFSQLATFMRRSLQINKNLQELASSHQYLKMCWREKTEKKLVYFCFRRGHKFELLAKYFIFVLSSDHRAACQVWVKICKHISFTWIRY